MTPTVDSPPVSVPVHFIDRADRALHDEQLRAAVRHATDLLMKGRQVALGGLEDSDVVRDEARRIRSRVLSRLPDILDRWATNLEARGGHVHWATDADEAVEIILDIARRRGARLLVKGKSMASEEIHLNSALEARGHEVVETDLGEFIIQLAGETPSHLIAPAIHKDRYDVEKLFTADAGHHVGPDITEEAGYARRRLRSSFLEADIGISGVNCAVAETGTIGLVENEGNGRLCTSVPPVHIAIMGMERIVETWEDLDVILSLLARSATGQPLSVYTNLITGPKRPGELDGPEELHVVVLDNGRSAALGTEYAEILNCIRCGACLNVCPVYRQVGGHAYDSVYGGPIGAVLTPLLNPASPGGRELPEASSLCGACAEVCPVHIPLDDMLLRLRHRDARADSSRMRRLGFSAWSWLWATRPGYALSTAAARRSRGLASRLPSRGWLGAWREFREIPPMGRRDRRSRP